MNILGPDYLVFGVDDLAASAEYLTAFGLTAERDGVFAARDGTGVVVRRADDPDLPSALPTGNRLRQLVFGVREASDLEAIAAELARDRSVTRSADGAVEAVDDMGFSVRFQVSVRRALDAVAPRINTPGAPQRRPNEMGVVDEMTAAPQTLSHLALFVPDAAAAARFYCERLGFVITDVLTGAGPFLRPAACDDHHALFFIQTPPTMQGLEHLAFHMAGPMEVMLAGNRFVSAGYQSYWGPGRHKFGSNWFWYFNSPLGCHFEYDADMDKVDDRWIPREAAASADTAQLFLFQRQDPWFPSGPPPGAADAH